MKVSKEEKLDILKYRIGIDREGLFGFGDKKLSMSGLLFYINELEERLEIVENKLRGKK